MVINERLTSYLHSLEQEAPPFFDALRKEAEAENVPIIRRESERFLKTLLAVQKPTTVLEIGTGVAFSTLVFAEYGKEITSITTIENFPPRIEKAKANMAAFFEEGRRDEGWREEGRREEGRRRAEDLQITLLEEDAAEAIARLDGPYDFIFLDGPKAQYIVMLPDLLRLLAPGGVLVADNVLQEGELIESRYATPRRQRTIHERMREFIWQTMHEEQLESSLLTVGDGMIVSVKKS